MSRILIASYSLTGATDRAAERLARLLDATHERIAERQPRLGPLGALGGALGTLTGAAPAIATPKRDPAAFDLVVLAGPVWAAAPATPLRSYARAVAGRPPRSAFLFTMGGSGADRAARQLQAIWGRPPLAVLALTSDDFKARRDGEKLRAFAEQLRAALEAPPGPR